MTEKVEIPTTLDTPAFGEAWGEFLAHRCEIRKRLTPRAQRMQLRKLERWGAPRAIAAIEHSVGNGYVGLFEDPAQLKTGKAAGRGNAPMGLWEINEREKALRNELDSLGSNFFGPDAERVNAERSEQRRKISAKLRELKTAKLGLA